MMRSILLSVFFMLLIGLGFAQSDSLHQDSLYKRAVEMTNEINSSKTNFAEKEKVPGFLVSNAQNSTDSWTEFPASNSNSANPNNASGPVDALILGAVNGLYNIKKKK